MNRFQFFMIHTLSGKLILELNEMFEKYHRTLQEIFMAIQGKLRPIHFRGMPLVTICIPTRNEERFIGQALYAIRKINIYPRVEIIVIDQESTDKTIKIAKGYGAKIITLEYKIPPKIGISRHVCSLEARGEIIVQIDADTVITPFVIPRAVIYLTQNDIGIYHVSHYYYDGDLLLNLIAHYYDKYFRKPNNTTDHFIAYTKTLYNYVQFDPNITLGAEDYDFGKRAFKKFGEWVFKFDKEIAVLVSSRGYKRRGLLTNLDYLLRST